MTDRWRELYDSEDPRLLRALLAIGGDPDATEDAAQEAFVRAHRAGLDSLQRPGAWLLVVGTRELLRDRRRRRTEDEKWAQRGPMFSPDASDTAAERADLVAALRQLPERQRAIVVARYFDGFTYDEIARHFEIKSGTVGATLHQATGRQRQIQSAGRLARGAMR